MVLRVGIVIRKDMNMNIDNNLSNAFYSMKAREAELARLLKDSPLIKVNKKEE